MTDLQDPQRRLLLKLATAASAASLMPLQLARAAQQSLAQAMHWQNWSGNQQATPKHFVYPGDEASLQRVLQQDNLPVRCFGGSHSFSALVPEDGGVLISLEQMLGLKSHDAAANTATFGAGTRLGMASQLAYGVGQSIPNEPDINLQSLAGAISTCTHGTGIKQPSLSACVKSLRLMTPDGKVHVIDASSPYFHAARVSLGALGVITEVTFQNLPAFKLEERTRVVSIREAMDIAEREKDQHRSIEFFAFPFGDTAILKTLDVTDQPDTDKPLEDSNSTLEMACEVVMRAGWMAGPIQKLLGFFVADEVRRGPSSKIFATPRSVRFNEMEYCVPVEQGMTTLEEAMHAMKASGENVFFPIEFRYTAPEDNWLSQFYHRTGVSISIHQYFKQDYKPLFEKVEPILKRHEGRPHWGKLNTFTTADARRQYEHFDDFVKIQRELDPAGRMLNPYLKQLFGGKA